MKFLIAALFVTNAFAATNLSKDWVVGSTSENTSQVKESFQSILSAQGEALERMDQQNTTATGFKFSEMVTDIAVTKSGLFGLSALKSNKAAEIKWKRNSSSLVEDEADIQVEGNISDEELKELSDTVITIAESSRKVKVTDRLKKEVYENMASVDAKIRKISLAQYNGWKVDGMRVDISLGAQGEVWMFVKAGASLRVRLEWKINAKKPSGFLENEETKFVARTMHGLGEALKKITIPGFDPKKVSVGVGGSYKKGFSLWKGNAGFMGYIMFVPAPASGLLDETVPTEWFKESFVVGGSESEGPGTEKGLIGRTMTISHEQFMTGMEKSLKTTAFFAENADSMSTLNWSVSEIKTINDISYKGLFGLADFTSKGAIEIDFKKKKKQSLIDLAGWNEAVAKLASLEVIRVRSVVEGGIDVPGVTNFSVNPEVELFYTRK